ncbi:EAL domain-containing protein [Roseobacter sp. YSTF-M11]|uniref:EAL domain-containing protein n=1 Tax=Roseobacter insulae TaxID=2859783 RepID=A0A9X1FXZ0_9RHOB|nr:EAL domain-containing protein [Roseobacter insulae]MBW4709717.1 EAL domain-containing protein [Roseobacter insulae]
MQPKNSIRVAIRLAPVLVIGVLIIATYLMGVLRLVDTRIGDLRMLLSPKAVSEDVVMVAIDDKSLKEIGQWPWLRDTHARLLNRLTEAGARDVFFDVDFAFAGDPADDQRFIDALEQAGGSTYLSAFSQAQTAASNAPFELSYNLPYAPFYALSWPVLVNVPSDPDGLVRHYLFSAPVNGEDLPSAASMLSGVFGPPGEQFTINYSLSPETIPVYSAIDVLQGTVPDAALKGKSVVIGAFALELRDNFAVPVHGIIPGAMVHALATETLAMQLVPRHLTGLASIVLLLATVVIFQTKGRDFSPWMLICQTVLVIATTEVAGLVLFRMQTIQLTTGALYPGFLLYSLWRLGQALDLSQWLIRKSRAEVVNTKRVMEQVFKDSSDMIVVIDHKGAVLNSSRSADFLIRGRPDGQRRLPEAFEGAAMQAIAAHHDGRWSAQGFQEARVEDRVLQYVVTPSFLEVASKARGQGTIHKSIATVSARDVTVLRQKEEQLTYLSNHDERTGALRRPAFLRCLQDQLDAGRSVTVIALNLHRFKTINITFGRDVGDLVLNEVVARLTASENRLSPVVRVSGDRFAVFSVDDADETAPVQIAERIKEMIAAPYVLGDAQAQIGARIGFVSQADPTRASASELLDQAEEALDEAQQLGGTRIQCHEPEQVSRKIRARAIERAMWTAIEQEEFNLVYQPQVSMIDGRLIGVEALLRWTSPTIGKVFPDQFIEIAESNGFIQEIGRWVLKKATRDALHLPSDVEMAVNVSALQMLDADLIGDVQASLRESGLSADRLCLELTESVFMTPSHCVVETMRDLEMLGVSWALDDFGTGYSSLAYLSTLPLRKLKLDKCFTQALGEDAHALTIVRSVVKLCEGMSIELLCEGVETEEHAQLLLAERCTEAQGYYYGKPQSIDDIRRNFLSARQALNAV